MLIIKIFLGKCGGTLTHDSGQLSSPMNLDSYESNVHCEWLIRVAQTEKIQLNFTEFSVEYSIACRWDYVEVSIVHSYLIAYI